MASSLPRSTPESQGIPSSAIRAMVERMARQEIHSLMVVRHGHVVAEGWWRPFMAELPHQLFSLSKSFCSTAVGLLVGEGKLSIDERVVDIFPDLAPAERSENLRQMRVRDLLTMTCGHAVEAWAWPNFSRAEMRGGFLAHEVAHAPGQHFMYNSLGTYMCSAIVQRRAGQSLTEYLKPRLYEPLGFEAFPWEKDAQGIDMGGWGLSLHTESIAKFGQLLLQDGFWEGRRLVPSTWIAQASAKQVKNGDGGTNDWAQGYGFQFWRCQPDCYRGDGAFGQLCVVAPQHNLVVAVTASVDDIQAELQAIWDELFPKLHPAPLPESQEAADLRAHLSGLALPTLEADASPANSSLGGLYRLAEEGGRDLGVTLTDRSAHLEVSGAQAMSLPAGFGQWLEGEMEGESVAACAAWRSEGRLELKIRWLQRTRGETWMMHAEGSRLRVDRTRRGVLGGEPPAPWTGERIPS